MGWIFLVAAIAMEVIGTIFLKLSDGLAKWYWGVASFSFYAVSFWLFAPALKFLPLGVAYAVWAGIAIVATVMIGWFAFSETLNLVQILCIVLILVGSVGLRLSTNS